MNNSSQTESTKQLADNETPWYRKRAVLIGAGSLVIAVAVIGAMALGGATDPNEGQRPVAEAPADPSETPIETVEPTPEQTEAPEAMPQNLEAYQQMPFETFNQLPKSEQAIYVSWLVRGMDTFVSEWQNQKMGPNDNIYTEASLDSTGQEAMNSGGWLRRMALSFDTEDAKKAMSFSFITGQELGYDTLMSETNVPNRKPRSMAEAEILPIPTVTSETEPAKDGFGIYFMELNALDTRTGSTLKEIVYYYEFTDYNNQVFSIWL